jgi:hypothetical protein
VAQERPADGPPARHRVGWSAGGFVTAGTVLTRGLFNRGWDSSERGTPDAYSGWRRKPSNAAVSK